MSHEVVFLTIIDPVVQEGLVVQDFTLKLLHHNCWFRKNSYTWVFYRNLVYRLQIQESTVCLIVLRKTWRHRNNQMGIADPSKFDRCK